MITNPRPLTTGEILLLCAGALVVVVLGLRGHRSVPFAIAVALLATVAVTAPFTAWSVGKDALRSRHYSSFAAARVGPEDNGVDTTVVDRAASIIPRHASYEIVVAPGVGVDRSGVFRFWAQMALLPRVTPAEPSAADWVISLGAPPAALGVRASHVRAVPSQRGRELTAWVGERL